MRYDLVFEVDRRFFRVQCKSARFSDGAVVIQLRTCRRTANGYIRTLYTSSEIDLVAAYCHENDTAWLVPIDHLEGLHQFHIRMEPARNGQLAAINSAAQYEFDGAVAQLEEHLSGTQRVVGSSPISSIEVSEAEAGVVGAEEFGLHAPRYVQRAAAGEEFLITRRGKRMARLVPADPVQAALPSLELATPPPPGPADRRG